MLLLLGLSAAQAVMMVLPWAVIFRDLGLFGLVEALIFILVLAVGLVYAWKKGALRWD